MKKMGDKTNALSFMMLLSFFAIEYVRFIMLSFQRFVLVREQ